MGLNKVSKNGNMYSFVTHTWNPVRGLCPYDCSYCYVKKWGNRTRPIRLDEKDLRLDLGFGKFIFICSGCDLFHPEVPEEWIKKVIEKTYDNAASDNKFLFHTKNPERAVEMYEKYLPKLRSVLCATVESNIPWPGISKAPQPYDRIYHLKHWPGKTMVTVEPIMDFDAMTFSEMITNCKPCQVNIGADSGDNKLPEPPREKIEKLIELLAPHTKIHLKKNLRRLLPESRYYEN